MMPIMRRIIAVVCLLTASVIGVAACADPRTTPAGTASTPATWATYVAEVSAVTPGPGANAVTVHVKPPTGPDCWRDIRVGQTTEENGVIFANVVEDLASSAAVGTCPMTSPAEVKLTSPKPIGNRTITLNHKAWTLNNGAYSRCDENRGCNPSKDHCDSTWIRATVRGLDVSSHSQGTVESCDSNWLVMTVPDDPAACGVSARAGCDTNSSVRRYFLQNKPDGWATVARTSDGGCDAVLKAEPAFPRKRCTDLQPTSH
jgi:hypothetical protein